MGKLDDIWHDDVLLGSEEGGKDSRSYMSLSELNSMVRYAIENTLPDSFWVEAELAQAQENGGHCYMELIEKDQRSNIPVARARATCWRNRWMLLRPHFERITGQTILTGMKVLLKVHATFHENYGFSWNVDDIDPTFTMGDMARKRQEIISRLKEEGVFDLQKELSIPMFCQHIAVVSSETAAGYGDFCNQLEDNEYGLKFKTRLFPAIMQGEGVEKSVIAALNSIHQSEEVFDCVVIIRGGGSATDLSGFDSLALAENVANFPLPIITGIGHERDENVLDMISFRRVKTPTAAAAFLIDHLAAVYNDVTDCQTRIVSYLSRRVQMERMRFEQIAEKIPVLFGLVMTRQTSMLDKKLQCLVNAMHQKIVNEQHRVTLLAGNIRPMAYQMIKAEEHRLDMLQKRTEILDPQLLLSRGYSITIKDGHAVKDASGLKKGDEIETRLAKGTIRSTVE